MKKITLFKSVLFLSVLIFSTSAFAQVGVGTTTPSSRSQLEVASESKGVLLPRLVASQVSALATSLITAASPLDSGMVIFNITENCVQVWDGVKFACLAAVSGGSLGNAGVVKVNVIDATPPAGLDGTARAAAALAATGNVGTVLARQQSNWIGWNSSGGTTTSPFDLGVFGAFNFAVADLTISLAPTTSWPENEPNKTLTGGIWTNAKVFNSTPPPATGETNDAWRENDIPGQVHIWRIIIYGGPANSNGGDLELRIRNPQTGFVSGYTQPVPAKDGLYSQTFTITTIADNGSLPVGTGAGTGNGYVIEVRSNANTQDIWIDSITRISIYSE